MFKYEYMGGLYVMGKFGDAIIIRWAILRGLLGPFSKWLVVFLILFFGPYLLPIDWFVNRAARISFSGMLLQFAGLMTIVMGLNQLGLLFGKVPLLVGLGRWFRRFAVLIKLPKPVGARIEMVGTATVSATGSSARVWAHVSSEERFKKLESAVDEVEAQVQTLGAELRQARKLTSTQFDHERAEWQRGDREIEKKLEKVTIGDIHLDLGGIAYLFFGIAFTSVPEWIVVVLSKIPVPEWAVWALAKIRL